MAAVVLVLCYVLGAVACVWLTNAAVAHRAKRRDWWQ